MKKAKEKAKLAMNCLFHFCEGTASVKLCRNGDYYWRCTCQARGFFTETHFKELDKSKNISLH